jgi:hypothetical protein
MRLIFSALMLSLFYIGNAQYISNVSIPDSNNILTTDSSVLRVKYANTITANDLRNHLSVLASDEYQGRETGKPGIDKAADYIIKELNKNGAGDKVVNKSTSQKVAFTFTSWKDTEIFINGNRYRHLWDYLSFPNKNKNQPAIISDEIYFLGYGIDDKKYTDYKKKKLKGKIIMINQGEPLDKNGNSHITGSTEMSDWSSNINKKLRVAKNKGVALVLIIDSDIQKKLGENRRFLLGPSVDLGNNIDSELPTANHAYISTNMAKAIIGSLESKVIKRRKKITKKGKFKPLKLKADITANQLISQKIIEGKNIVGFIEGTDKKDEVIVISAHYDHIGMRGEDVYNGADDNGSGTSTLLEITLAFAYASQDSFFNKRSIAFIWMTGEEKGLLGSQYYSENPIHPIDNTVANINIDMVGRIDKKYTTNPNYIYVIGSDRLSSDLHTINEDINKKYSGLTLDYTYNDEDDPNRYYYRSDHYNFARKGIPAIFFFNGVHDDYHQASDTVDKINFDIMAKRGQQIFQLAWELANREERINVDGQVK